MTSTASGRAPPFFVVGCSRSGTTLLQTLIDAHPELAIPPESHIYDRFGPVFGGYGDLRVRRNRLRFIDDLLRDAFIRQWQLDVTARDVERRLERTDRVGVIATLFALYAERKGATRWGDKTPEHIRHLAAIRADFPGAKLVHLVRDGRDVAEAMRRMVFGPVSALGLAEEWVREVAHWRAFCAAHGEADTLVLRYEDLVAAPHDTVARVFAFLGVPYVDTVAEYASTPLSRALGRQTAWHSSLRGGISTAKVGVYRRRLTPREIEIIEAVAGETLAAYGYALEHAAPRGATFGHRQYAFVADRVVRWGRKLLHPSVVHLELQARLRFMQRRSARTRAG